MKRLKSITLLKLLLSKISIPFLIVTCISFCCIVATFKLYTISNLILRYLISLSNEYSYHLSSPINYKLFFFILFYEFLIIIIIIDITSSKIHLQRLRISKYYMKNIFVHSFFLFIIILTIILTSTWPSKVKFFLKKVKSKNERKQVKNLWNILICNVYDLYYNQLNQRREAKCLKLKLFTCLNQKFFQDPIIWDHED